MEKPTTTTTGCHSLSLALSVSVSVSASLVNSVIEVAPTANRRV